MELIPYIPPTRQQGETKAASAVPKEKTHPASSPPEISEDVIQVEPVRNPESDPESEDEDCRTPPTIKETPLTPEANKPGIDRPTRSPLRDLDWSIGRRITVDAVEVSGTKIAALSTQPQKLQPRSAKLIGLHINKEHEDGEYCFSPDPETTTRTQISLDEGLVIVEGGMFKALAYNYTKKDTLKIPPNTIIGYLNKVAKRGEECLSVFLASETKSKPIH